MSGRVWIGREEAGAAAWRAALADAGWRGEALPLIRGQALAPRAEEWARLARLDDYAWAFFASARGVAECFRRRAERAAPAWPAAVWAAAVGHATAAALLAREVVPALIGEGGGAALAASFLARGEDPARPLLVIGARGGRPELRAALAAAGYTVELVELYDARSVAGPAPPAGEPVLLFSPSGARALAARVADPALHPVWAIGPTTAAAAAALGFPVAGVLSRPEPTALRDLLPS